MIGSTWQYTDDRKLSVARTLPDGSMESCIADSEKIQAFVAAGGNIIDAPDLPDETPTITVEALTAALVAKGVISQTEVDAQAGTLAQADEAVSV